MPCRTPPSAHWTSRTLVWLSRHRWARAEQSLTLQQWQSLRNHCDVPTACTLNLSRRTATTYICTSLVLELVVVLPTSFCARAHVHRTILTQWLRAGADCPLRTLSLANNPLGDAGVALLGAALQDQVRGTAAEASAQSYLEREEAMAVNSLDPARRGQGSPIGALWGAVGDSDGGGGGGGGGDGDAHDDGGGGGDGDDDDDDDDDDDNDD